MSLSGRRFRGSVLIWVLPLVVVRVAPAPAPEYSEDASDSGAV
ncbi:MAG: hypothetical protein R2763_01760 [Mycobacterium sp.]